MEISNFQQVFSIFWNINKNNKKFRKMENGNILQITFKLSCFVSGIVLYRHQFYLITLWNCGSIALSLLFLFYVCCIRVSIALQSCASVLLYWNNNLSVQTYHWQLNCKQQKEQCNIRLTLNYNSGFELNVIV